MVYLRENTSIPIPKIYMHDNDADGVVGGPWMVMDYVSTNCLSSRSPQMNTLSS